MSPRRPLPGDESALEAQLREHRVDKAVTAALTELDGHPEEPMLAMMAAAKIVVASSQAVAALDGTEKAVRMLLAFQADLSVRVLNALRAVSGRLVSES